MELEDFNLDRFPVDKIAEYAQRKRDRRRKTWAWIAAALVSVVLNSVCTLAIVSVPAARIIGYCCVALMAMLGITFVVSVVFASIYHGCPNRLPK